MAERVAIVVTEPDVDYLSQFVCSADTEAEDEYHRQLDRVNEYLDRVDGLEGEDLISIRQKPAHALACALRGKAEKTVENQNTPPKRLVKLLTRLEYGLQMWCVDCGKGIYSTDGRKCADCM
jgi:hypothetical protein